MQKDVISVSTRDGHGAEVRCIAIGKAGQRNVTGARDDTVLVWNLETKTTNALSRRKQGSMVRAIAISPEQHACGHKLL